MNKTLLFLFCILMSGCNIAPAVSSDTSKVVQQEKVTYPVSVNLKEALLHTDKNLTLSDFVKSIEYISLNLKNNYLKFFTVSGYDEKEELFFIGDFFNCFAVNRKGEIVSRIGKLGQGPGEYQQIATASIDYKRKIIYINAAFTNRMQSYNYTGRFLKSNFVINKGDYFTAKVSYNNDNFLAIGEIYHSGYENIKSRLYNFGVMDTLGDLMLVTPSLSTTVDTKKEKYVAFMPLDATYNKEHSLFLTSGYSDAVFTIEENKIVPRYLFDYGSEKPDLTELWQGGSNDLRMTAIYNSIFIFSNAYETGRYFIIKATKEGKEYIICHDKYLNENKSVRYDYADIPVQTKEDMGGSGAGIPSQRLGFFNDVDGGIDAYPVIMSSDGNYWVSFMNSYEMKAILTDEYFAKRKNTQNKAQQQKLKDLVNKLGEEDHQVLILMKLKEEVK